jgi:hypothetical protein
MSVSAARADINLDAEIGAEHSDNVGRVATDEQSDTIGTARITLMVEEMRPRLEARIAADAQYRHYFDDTFDNEVVGGLSGDVAWSILPERFIWIVQDNYGQIAANRAEPDTPDNREDFNYFTTGPDLRLPLGERTYTELSARWSDVYYETSEQGSENVEGSLGIGRLISEQATLSLNASAEDIKYGHDELFEDYRITEGFLRYELEGLRTQLELDAGYSEAERGKLSSGGAIGRLHLSREITSRTTFSVDLGSEFADTATAFRIDQVAGGVSPGSEDAVAAADVFRTTYAYLRLGTERERTIFDIVVNGRRERHESEVILDRDSFGGGFVVSRRLTARLDLGVRGTYTDEEFVNTGFAFKEWVAGAELGWRLTNRVSVRVSADHFKGLSEGESRDYEEERYFLGVRYSSAR